MAVETLILPAAERDIDEAYSWYELIRSGLGEEFLTPLRMVNEPFDVLSP